MKQRRLLAKTMKDSYERTGVGDVTRYGSLAPDSEVSDCLEVSEYSTPKRKWGRTLGLALWGNLATVWCFRNCVKDMKGEKLYSDEFKTDKVLQGITGAGLMIGQPAFVIYALNQGLEMELLTAWFAASTGVLIGGAIKDRARIVRNYLRENGPFNFSTPM